MGADRADVSRLMANGLWDAFPAADGREVPSIPLAPTSEPRTHAKHQAILQDAPRSTAVSTVISRYVLLTGSIETPDGLQIFGQVMGNIRAAAVMVCEGGIVKGEVIADAVRVHGAVEGSIRSKTVHLVASASVRGDIVHDVLSIEPGAQFEGMSSCTLSSAMDAPTS